MKRHYVILCEGPSEKRLMERLLEEKLLCFDKTEVVSMGPLLHGEIKWALPEIHAIPPKETVVVLRVGDTLTDKWIPQKNGLGFRAHEGTLSVERICTKPEIEILVIIARGKLKEFAKSSLKPKGFVRGVIKRPKDFYDFLDAASNEELVAAIHEYRKEKGHAQKEKCLADYLKK